MIDYAAIRPGILSLVKSISGIDTVWKDQPQRYVRQSVTYGPPSASPGTICKLSIGPASVKGRDELRTEYDENQAQGQELQDTATGIRLLTLKITVETFDQTDGKTAEYYIEAIRTRFRFQSTLNTLTDLNCALISFADIVLLPETRDSRAVSIASLDVRLSCRATDIDPIRRGYIDTVEPPDGTFAG